MYRNYDGQGSTFGDTSLQATSTDPDQLAIYAARRSQDGALTLMVINKTNQGLSSAVSLAGFSPTGAVQVYRYSDANLAAIVHEADLVATESGLAAEFPANSITLLVIP